MATTTKVIGDKEYSVSAAVSSFNHICTYREVHDYKMTVKKKDDRFGRFVKYNGPLSEKELQLISSMFAKNILGNINSDHRGIMLTLSTGNSFMWDYTKDQHVDFTPLFEVIKPSSSMPLYREEGEKSYLLPGVDYDDAYCELSMLHFSRETLLEHRDNYNRLVREMEEELPEPEQPVAPQGITEDAIRQYLNSRG